MLGEKAIAGCFSVSCSEPSIRILHLENPFDFLRALALAALFCYSIYELTHLSRQKGEKKVTSAASVPAAAADKAKRRPSGASASGRAKSQERSVQAPG